MNCHHHLCSPQAAHSCRCSPLRSQNKLPEGCYHFQVPLSYQSCLPSKIDARNYFLGTDIYPRPGYNQPANKNSSGSWRQDKREIFSEAWFSEKLGTCGLYQLQQLVLRTSAKTKSPPCVVPEAGFEPKDVQLRSTSDPRGYPILTSRFKIYARRWQSC